ncbi:methylmalonyl-CoA mutase small subunit [Ornithinimicrobium panacihumi]|uniref:methylmalonyl-CoA mutase small subunit n=1 Tax=Ornithinimicrobium panacihumi TaxID=2008449 RepID=UPI003F88C7B3
MTSTQETDLPLAEGFEALDHAQWQDLVAKVLNRGRPADKQLDGPAAEARLRTTTVDGLTIDALYEADDVEGALGFPGVMPFTRGSGQRSTDLEGPWDVRVLHEHPDAAAGAAAVLDDLEHGATSVWVEVGDHAVRPDDLGTVLGEVMLDLAPVVVSSASDQAAAADALRSVWRDRGVAADVAMGGLGFDPIGHAARTGSAPRYDEMLAATTECLASFPQVRAITVDVRLHHDAGAGDVDEVAFALATALDYLRQLEAAGISPADAFGQIDFRLAATADQFLTIAKLRALRRGWARIGEECGVPEADRGARIHAVTSARMVSRDDPYVNMLRTTVATFGAAVGGADAITVLPFDAAAGLPDRFSRRMARNTQIILAEESHVGKVLDPAGGSWYVESLTDELARAAWGVLQELERDGGMASALAAGKVEERVAATSLQRAARLADRSLPLTGVSMFPQTDEKPLQRAERPAAPSWPEGLTVQRDAAVFEQLRDRATAHAQEQGHAPQVFLACLGTRRDFGARETFTSALLAVAGIASPRSEGGTADEIAAQAKDAGATVAVLCSSSEQYAQHGAEVAAALREAGVQRLYVAGRASELGEAADVVDGELSAGMDVVTALTGILDVLGAPMPPVDPAAPADTTSASKEQQS